MQYYYKIIVMLFQNCKDMNIKEIYEKKSEVEKLSFRQKFIEFLNISISTFYNWLRGRTIPPKYHSKINEFLTQTD